MTTEEFANLEEDEKVLFDDHVWKIESCTKVDERETCKIKIGRHKGYVRIVAFLYFTDAEHVDGISEAAATQIKQ